MIDTPRVSRRLQEAGFEEAQADALVGVLADDFADSVATKSDIALLEERLNARIDALEQRMIIRLGGLVALATGLTIAAIAIAA